VGTFRPAKTRPSEMRPEITGLLPRLSRDGHCSVALLRASIEASGQLPRALYLGRHHAADNCAPNKTANLLVRRRYSKAGKNSLRCGSDEIRNQVGCVRRA
jgi:hypothetical protein